MFTGVYPFSQRLVCAERRPEVYGALGTALHSMGLGFRRRLSIFHPVLIQRLVLRQAKCRSHVKGKNSSLENITK